MLLVQALLAIPAPPPRPVSFRNDVLPIVSRAGCNQGTCHGNGEGRGGFKLSLKGEDPEHDYSVITLAGGGRRVNRSDPADSLLLKKATATVPHGGGLRFKATSEECRTLATWIAQGAHDDEPSAPKLVALDVTPKEKVLVLPARVQQLQVSARFSDGTRRDVTTRSVYNCGDPALEVTPDGKVTADRGADAAVMVRYADQMQSVRLTFVPARPGFRWIPVQTSNVIDEINFRRLKTLRLQPSRLTTDAEFLRRAYLDSIGTLPTPDEVRAFLADTRSDKRSRLIEALLQRPEFDEFWTLKWSDLLRLEERSLDPKGVSLYRDWIKKSVHENKPLDQFARELITGTGSTYVNPPANYYRRSRDPVELAESTAQIFLGTRMLCAKCHNHPFERWKQEDYYALAAFFARVDRKGELTRKDKFDKHELIGEETISAGAKGEVENPRTGKPIAPRLPFTTQPIDLEKNPDPRIPLAEWITSPRNPLFAKSLVSRIWYHLMGKGIIDPVDDIRDTNPPSNPELLDTLTRDFVAHKFDLRYMVRLIMNSRTYQLASEPNKTNAEDERFFSRAIAQRVPAEVLLDALSQVTGEPESFDTFPAGTRAIQLYARKKMHPFLKTFGQPPRESVCECERTNETTLAQSFALISGTTLDAKLRSKDNRIGKLIAAGKSNEEVIREFYLASVTREPSKVELQKATQYVAKKTDRRAALEDLLWALLNSKEFLLRR